MSMQIKTVWNTVPETFDKEINSLLEDGWHLSKFELVSTPTGKNDYLYAVMTKGAETAQEPEPAPITWQQAVETIKGVCSGRADCITGDECPMFCYCHTLNVDWGVPFEWPEVPHD